MKRCYEYIDQAHNHRKFWVVQVVDRHCLVTFGRIGSSKQTQVKSFPSEGLARGHALKLSQQKESKGYDRVEDNKYTGADPAMIVSLGGPNPVVVVGSEPPAEEPVRRIRVPPRPPEEEPIRRIRRDL